MIEMALIDEYGGPLNAARIPGKISLTKLIALMGVKEYRSSCFIGSF
jgi:hypothetical protein